MKSLLIVAGLVSMALSANAQLVTGLQGAAGSTVGPGGQLFVTEGLVGRVSRVDPRTGSVDTYAEGLPPSVIGLGGAVDIAFLGDTGYVLVTVVSLFSNAIDGIYRIDGPDEFTVIADLGAWSWANLPSTPFDLPTGVQWSIETYRGGFLVSDGHHNRVLHVTRDGVIRELKTFENVVPTGLEVSGDTIYVAQTGPVPHAPEDGKVVSFTPNSNDLRIEAAGAPLLLDVELGRGRSLFALSQGAWNGTFPGSPALPFEGALWEIGLNGALTLVADGINLPNSVEIIQNDAYVVTLAGEILKIENVASPAFGTQRRR